MLEGRGQISRGQTIKQFGQPAFCSFEFEDAGMSSSGSRKEGGSANGAVLGKAVHEVHVLHCLTGRAFGDVVNCRHDDNPPGSGIKLHADVTAVAAAHMLGCREGSSRADADKGFIAVRAFVQRLNVLLADIAA